MSPISYPLGQGPALVVSKQVHVGKRKSLILRAASLVAHTPPLDFTWAGKYNFANIILGSFFTSAAFLCCAPALPVFVLILCELHLAAVNHLLFTFFSLGVSHISAKFNVSTIDLLLKP